MILLEIIISFFLLTGSFFVFIGAVGLYRLPDFFTRLHAPTKATTVGVGGVLIASMLFFSFTQSISLHEILVTFFLFVTSPVSAHMLSKAGMQQKLPVIKETQGKNWEN